MTDPLVLTLPAADPMLRDELAAELAPYADVHAPPPEAFDLATVALYVSVVGGVVGMAANAVQIYDTLRKRREAAQAAGAASGISVGAPGQPAVPLEQADDRLLRQLLGIGDQHNG